MIRFTEFVDHETGAVTKKVEVNGLKSIAISTFLVRTQPDESLSLLQMIYDIEQELKNGNARVERLMASVYADCTAKTSVKKVLKGELSLKDNTPLEEDKEYLRIDAIVVNPTKVVRKTIKRLVFKELGLPYDEDDEE